MNERVDKVEEFVAAIFANSTQKKYWPHTQRVHAYASRIGRDEGADLDVLLPAVWLHDIGMTVDAGFPSHVEKSKMLATCILKGCGYDDKTSATIVKVLGAHHPRPGAMLDTLEEKVLYDADNMDIIGVFGVLRWIGTMPQTTKELVASIDLFVGIVDSCVTARGSLFFTQSARKIGDSVVSDTVAYFGKVKSHLLQFEVEGATPAPFSF
jgi:hypothetical protein